MASESKTNFSAVIITFNEAHNLPKCLEALTQVTNDIWIADSGSTDGTIDIAHAHGAQVQQVEWQGYANTKNAANQLCRYDWVLSIDADEVLSPELVDQLRQLQVRPNRVYALDRITQYCGQWVRHSGWYPDWKPRLFDRREVRWQGEYVHEVLCIPKHYTIEKLEGHLYHYSYRSLEDHDQRIEKYARLSAQQLFEQGKKVSLLKRLFSPGFRYFKTYILKKGFLDGKAGREISKRDAKLVRRKHHFLDQLH